MFLLVHLPDPDYQEYIRIMHVISLRYKLVTSYMLPDLDKAG